MAALLFYYLSQRLSFFQVGEIIFVTSYLSPLRHQPGTQKGMLIIFGVPGLWRSIICRPCHTLRVSIFISILGT